MRQLKTDKAEKAEVEAVGGVIPSNTREDDIEEEEEEISKLGAAALVSPRRSKEEIRMARVVDFFIKSIQEKEDKLECPVCLVTAEAPIYMCPESHLIW